MNFFSTSYIGIFSGENSRQCLPKQSGQFLGSHLTYQPKCASITKETSTPTCIVTVSLKIYNSISLIFLTAIVDNVSEEIFSYLFSHLMVTFLKHSLQIIWSSISIFFISCMTDHRRLLINLSVQALQTTYWGRGVLIRASFKSFQIKNN